MGRSRITLSEGEIMPISEIAHRALTSGLSGMSAMVIQVTSLMWMRTIMNNQYRRGGTISQTVKKLYADGGLRRFYRGYSVAIFQGPLSRFGDTFANTLFISLMNQNQKTKDLPIALKTMGASFTAALYRIMLTPIDTTKTTLQVEGREALGLLRKKIAKYGLRVMYHGALASSAATFVGHFPWFFTFNYLDSKLPDYEDTVKKLGRRAGIGFVASIVSDSISNSLRVIKTTKQTYQRAITYPEVVKEIVDKDGVLGLMGRGLKTRILCNGIQGLMFSVLWKGFEDYFNSRRNK